MMYAHGAAAELIFLYPGVTASCPRCLLRSRFEQYEHGYQNDVDSSACPIFATERMNATKGYLALMLLLYHEAPGSPFNTMLDAVKDRNFVWIRLAPTSRNSWASSCSIRCWAGTPGALPTWTRRSGCPSTRIGPSSVQSPARCAAAPATCATCRWTGQGWTPLRHLRAFCAANRWLEKSPVNQRLIPFPAQEAYNTNNIRLHKSYAERYTSAGLAPNPGCQAQWSHKTEVFALWQTQKWSASTPTTSMRKRR